MSQKALLLPAILAAVLVHQSHSAPISIVNADFENGSASWTTSTSDNGNYWSFGTHNYGSFLGGGNYQFSSQMVRFWTANNHVSGRLWQTLNTTLQPSTTYTLSFQLFEDDRLSVSLPQSIGPTFYAGSTAIPWDSFVTPTVPSTGATWTYELTTSASEALVGENIKIEMYVGTGLFPNGVGSQMVHFDNITLEAVPEPSTYALLGLGAVATILFRLRRKKA